MRNWGSELLSYSVRPRLIHEDLDTRSCLVVATALSGAFGGLLAWAMLHMDGVANMAGWRW